MEERIREHNCEIANEALVINKSYHSELFREKKVMRYENYDT